MAQPPPSLISVVLAALREEHTVLRLFFIVPTLGQTRAQWLTLLFNTLAIRLLGTLIFFEHAQPSLISDMLVVVIGLLITTPSKVMCRKSFDQAAKFDFWRTQPPETRLRQLQERCLPCARLASVCPVIAASISCLGHAALWLTLYTALPTLARRCMQARSPLSSCRMSARRVVVPLPQDCEV